MIVYVNKILEFQILFFNLIIHFTKNDKSILYFYSVYNNDLHFNIYVILISKNTYVALVWRLSYVNILFILLHFQNGCVMLELYESKYYITNDTPKESFLTLFFRFIYLWKNETLILIIYIYIHRMPPSLSELSLYKI